MFFGPCVGLRTGGGYTWLTAALLSQITNVLSGRGVNPLAGRVQHSDYLPGGPRVSLPILVGSFVCTQDGRRPRFVR